MANETDRDRCVRRDRRADGGAGAEGGGVTSDLTVARSERGLSAGVATEFARPSVEIEGSPIEGSPIGLPLKTHLTEAQG